MSLNKKCSFWLLFAFSCFSNLAFAQNKTIKWVVSENSNLIVRGSTNLTSFQCIIPNFPKTDTIKIAGGAGAKNIPLSGVIKLQILNFDCKNGWMTKELRKTLKQTQFPYLEVRFLALNEIPDLNKKSSTVIGIVEIELAGAVKRYEVTFEIEVDASKTIYLSAIKDVNFTDFKIIPPTKMGNMVKTKDKLTVELSLAMRVL